MVKQTDFQGSLEEGAGALQMKFQSVSEDFMVTVAASDEHKQDLLNILDASLDENNTYIVSRASIILDDILRLQQEIQEQKENGNTLTLHRSDFVSLSSLSRNMQAFNADVETYDIAENTLKQVRDNTRLISELSIES